METKIGTALALILLLCGCEDLDSQRSGVRVQISPTVQPVPVPSQQPTSTPQTRDLKIQVTVDSAADLKVVAGTNVQAGQVISDRYSVKQKLATQRQLLAVKLQEIQQSDRTAVTTPQLEQAKLEVKAAELDLKEFTASRRWTSTAYEQFPALTEAEAKKGRELEERYQQAKNRLKELNSNFKTALAQDTQQKNLITKEIKTIDRQINQVGLVRSPYSGTIKEIKLIGLPGKELTAEITIAVPDRPKQLKKTPANTV
ncbi:hypothetical protein [Merismopedia glauca]|uniref:HlyD family secretion protein n=1 Tax=Merismopedia glauca CCAP 1448/3 TaxID=1296344 RepID=A0A2T1C7U6_9CYAN|nr:hypothetical protein [Merismopedia glauca]PSB04316.1 hypothetical protein C7B64_04410 [Merismopedia glauca CCAP 1448/3]